jgi:hypothetical protein
MIQPALTETGAAENDPFRKRSLRGDSLSRYTLRGKDWHIVIEFLEFQGQ